jgi:hypothetical protein
MRLATSTNASFEGEPLYSTDRALTPVGEFIYGQVIPRLLQESAVPAAIIETFFTVTYSTHMNADQAGALVSTAASNGPHLNHVRYNLTENSNQLVVARAGDIISGLNSRQLTKPGEVEERVSAGVTLLDMPGRQQIALTGSNSQPTAAVLDAASLLLRAEAGVDTVVTVHGNAYKGEQQRALAVLLAFNGELPFDAFYNVFIRTRDGIHGLGAITQTARNGTVTRL